MRITTLTSREDLVELVRTLALQIDQGHPIQVLTAPVKGVLATAAQKGLYFKYLQHISLQTGDSIPDLDAQVKQIIYGDPDVSLSSFSVEEYSAFLTQFIAFADEHFDPLPDKQKGPG